MIYKSPFVSPQILLSNAKAHINNLGAEIAAFTKGKPWTHLIEKDVQAGKQFHKVRFTEVLSERLPALVYDAASNLRSVLDQTGYAAAVCGGIIKPKRAYFPVADDESGLAHVIGRKKCRDLPPAILDLFKGFKPYKGGNNALWALNRLANTKKHAALIPVELGGFGIGGGKLQLRNVSDGAEIGFWHDDLKNEVTFIRAGINAEISYNTNFFFSVTFDPSEEVTGGHEPVRVLGTMAGEVERVLMATEAECRRLGLLT